MKKAFVLVVALTLMGLVGWKVYQNVTRENNSTGQRRPTAVAVETAFVKKAPIRDVALFTGTLQPRAYFVVAPKITGRVEKLLVNIGQRVKNGDLIALIDDDEYQQQVEQARAELEVARANLEERRSALEVARREFERVSSLRQKKIASESELDAAQANYKAQEAKYKVAVAQVSHQEAALKAAQVRLSYTKIRATWEDREPLSAKVVDAKDKDSLLKETSGALSSARAEGGPHRIVGERFVDEGAMLTPNGSIVSILDISSMTAVIHVIERDYSSIQVGQTAVVTTDAFPGRTFSGKILRIAPMLKEASRQARVEIEIPNPDELLKPGMFARAQIEFAKKDDATVVPLTALVKRDSSQGVFIVDDQGMKARFVPITLGIVHGGLAEVVNPPLSGMVVTLGHHLLEDGSSVILPGRNPGDQLKQQTGSAAGETLPIRGGQEKKPRGGGQ